MAHLTVQFFSEVLCKCQTIEVILPQKTYNQIGMEGNGGRETCQVLYLLHGQSDDQSIWMRRTSIERYASAYNLAVIMPNGDLSYYTDMYSGPKYMTYIAEELPKICHCFFPQISMKREDTFIAGLSMGGYGAFKIALNYPDKYNAAASLSGVLDLASRVMERKNEIIWKAIFGDVNNVKGSRDDILYLAETIDKSKPIPNLFACVGTSDQLYKNNLDAVAAIKNCGIPVQYEEGEGSHTWEFWDLWIQKALSFFELKK